MDPGARGAPLLKLYTSETEALIDSLNAAAAQAMVAETQARQERDRAVELLRYGLITPQAADEAQSALEAAAAAVIAARAQIRTAEARLAKFSIKSPMAASCRCAASTSAIASKTSAGGEPLFRVVDNACSN